jgi:hypothetical protein
MTKPCGSGDTVNGAVVQRVEATGTGLRPRPKGLDKPPDPTAAPAARAGAIRDVIGQKSAEAIVGVGTGNRRAPKGRTRWYKEEP